MDARSRRSNWFRRRKPVASGSEPPSDDVPTALPTARPAVVLVELAAAVLDLTPLGKWGFGDGPIGLAGTAVLETLACAGRQLDDSAEFDRVLAAAIAAGIFAGDLDHEWNEADPDGHYDNTWLGDQYRIDGFVLHLLQTLVPQSDAVAAVATLKSLGIRPVAIPFLGSARTKALLGPEMADVFEFADVDPAESLPGLVASIAGGSGVAHTEISAVTATRAMTEAAMAAGCGTVWVDRGARIRAFVYHAQARRSLNYRWGSTPPVPAIVDDLPAAVRLLSEVAGVPQ